MHRMSLAGLSPVSGGCSAEVLEARITGDDALDTADLDAREAELAELSAHLDAATHRQLTLIRILDLSEHWARRGAKSCAHWLSWRIALDPGAARERVRVARALGALPLIDDALRRGKVSYSKVRAMTRVATPENEERLLGMAENTTAAQLEKICRGVRQVQRADGQPKDETPERYVRLRHRGDGTVRFEAVLMPDEAERVMEALRKVRASMNEGLEVAPDHCDALMRIADAVLAGDLLAEEEESGRPAADVEGQAAQTRTSGADRAQVVVHFAEEPINGEHAAVLDDGARVSAETFRRLSCDCGLLGVQRDARGDVLDIGRKTRRIPPALRRAVMLRDVHCRFPGCTHDRFIDLHHIEHWLHGGATSKDNLIALCTFHHRLVHEGGFSMELGEDGEPRFTAPAHASLPFVHAPHIDTDALTAFEEAHAELAIDDETGLTSWDGEPIDYRACVGSVCAADEPPDFDLPVRSWLAKNGFEELA